MDKILDFFDFSNQKIGNVFGRLAVEVLLTVVVAFVVALIILVALTKKKEHKIGFTNWLKVSWLYGIDTAIAVLGVVVILTLRVNLANCDCYFIPTDFSWNWFWSWSSGYLLFFPEIFLFIAWMGIYWAINKQIYKSIN